ncbi:MAG: multicomponent Na+:H+ antiporter subunit [Thermotogota bacterium]|nr:multicomponent Na+:H+ antiporter subunit [Thermotogota bacterium]MDK2864585.1 multicomponent Na+:H+ antiporter subunit [Thermotogota bacterium]HCZ05631.1 cation:proton antiporter [Thermotogota bacterium]
MHLLILATIFIGFVGLLVKRNLVMKIISMDVMGTGVISFFVYLSSRSARVPPIVVDPNVEFHIADPVPQAVILTAIVIGFSILAILLVYVMILSKRFATLDTERIERRMRNWNR